MTERELSPSARAALAAGRMIERSGDMDRLRSALTASDGHTRTIPWPEPTPEMMATPEFEAVWQAIKSWDVNVPEAYSGYCGATGNHVRAILDALKRG